MGLTYFFQLQYMFEYFNTTFYKLLTKLEWGAGSSSILVLRLKVELLTFVYH